MTNIARCIIFRRNGQIGLWTNANGALLDDFNGGSGTGASASHKVLARVQEPKQVVAQATPPIGGWTISYYYFNGQRIAMRKRTDNTNGTVNWLHGDHLGSASLATNASGIKVSDMRFKPFGEVRSGSMPTDLTWTGQRAELSNYVGSLMDFGNGTRFYSTNIGRFLSADSIVPRPYDPQSLNRFSYSRNSPLTRIDPSGHADGDFWSDVGGFIIGVVYGVTESNFPPDQQTAQAADGLAAEQSSFAYGRLGGNVLGIVQGAIETVAGGASTIGSAPVCAGTGVGCVVTVGSAAVAAHGVTVVGNASIKLGLNASQISKGAGSGNLSKTPYEIAASGGKHSGFLNNYQNRSTKELNKSVKSLKNSIEKHEEFIKDPAAKWTEWANFDKARKQREIGHWQTEINDATEQIEILEEIIKRQGN